MVQSISHDEWINRVSIKTSNGLFYVFIFLIMLFFFRRNSQCWTVWCQYIEAIMIYVFLPSDNFLFILFKVICFLLMFPFIRYGIISVNILRKYFENSKSDIHRKKSTMVMSNSVHHRLTFPSGSHSWPHLKLAGTELPEQKDFLRLYFDLD